MSFDEIPIDERLDCQKVVVDTKDKHKLFGIIVKHKFSSKHNDLDPILIYFQGNAGNVLARIPIFSRILLSSSKGSVSNLQIIAISYRGYWLSTGSPSEVGIQKDSMSIYEFVREVYPKNPIYIYGHSLGGAVALHLASDPRVQKDLKGIIIENTFTSIEDMVTTIYPQKWLPYRYLVHIPLLLRNKWDNKRVIREISTPIMFLSSKKDELVPQDQMRELHELSRTSKVWVEFKNALHEDIFFHRGYCEAIYQFINETKL
ncbi:13640_t:CDS:2 [Acaulospora morrowiae]|uniref:13640_t:CDS:1 n=1 Tax=Acaulospora morrowiae TaxID=94023 RepID=A0A9N9C2H1_9GLOM|nr:13640_t:CDS:2 [Acaulospora morrowiae]